MEINKTVYCKDKLEDTCIIKVRIIPNIAILIRAYNEDANELGYMNIHFSQNNRFYLSEVYCYSEYRRRDIAKRLNEVSEYILKDYPLWIIRGSYEPTQMGQDRMNGVIKSTEELHTSASNYYENAGYTILSYEEYLKNPTKYPDINPRLDFELSEEISPIIIYKKVVPKEFYPFHEKGDIIIHNNYVDDYKNEEEIKEEKTK